MVLNNKCNDQVRVIVGPWEKTLPIAHYALPIVSQEGLALYLFHCKLMGNA